MAESKKYVWAHHLAFHQINIKSAKSIAMRWKSKDLLTLSLYFPGKNRSPSQAIAFFARRSPLVSGLDIFLDLRRYIGLYLRSLRLGLDTLFSCIGHVNNRVKWGWIRLCLCDHGKLQLSDRLHQPQRREVNGGSVNVLLFLTPVARAKKKIKARWVKVNILKGVRNKYLTWCYNMAVNRIRYVMA